MAAPNHRDAALADNINATSPNDASTTSTANEASGTRGSMASLPEAGRATVGGVDVTPDADTTSESHSNMVSSPETDKASHANAIMSSTTALNATTAAKAGANTSEGNMPSSTGVDQASPADAGLVSLEKVEKTSPKELDAATLANNDSALADITTSSSDNNRGSSNLNKNSTDPTQKHGTTVVEVSTDHPSPDCSKIQQSPPIGKQESKEGSINRPRDIQALTKVDKNVVQSGPEDLPTATNANAPSQDTYSADTQDQFVDSSEYLTTFLDNEVEDDYISRMGREATVDSINPNKSRESLGPGERQSSIALTGEWDSMSEKCARLTAEPPEKTAGDPTGDIDMADSVRSLEPGEAGEVTRYSPSGKEVAEANLDRKSQENGLDAVQTPDFDKEGDVIMEENVTNENVSGENTKNTNIPSQEPTEEPSQESGQELASREKDADVVMEDSQLDEIPEDKKTGGSDITSGEPLSNNIDTDNTKKGDPSEETANSNVAETVDRTDLETDPNVREADELMKDAFPEGEELDNVLESENVVAGTSKDIMQSDDHPSNATSISLFVTDSHQNEGDVMKDQRIDVPVPEDSGQTSLNLGRSLFGGKGQSKVDLKELLKLRQEQNKKVFQDSARQDRDEEIGSELHNNGMSEQEIQAMRDKSAREEHEKAIAKFEALERDFARKRKNNEIDMEKQVEFAQLRQAEFTRRNQYFLEMDIRQGYSHNDDEDLGEDEPIQRGDSPIAYQAADELSDEEFEENHFAKKRKTNAELKRLEAINPEDDLPDSIRGSTRARGRGGKRGGRPKKVNNENEEITGDTTNPKKRKRGAGVGKKPRGGGQTREKKTKDPKSMLDLGSLVTSNVFRDAQENVGAPEQPGFTVRTKDKALAQLLASIPVEAKASAKTDSDYLLEATKAFKPRGSCRADGEGHWNIRRMKTSLTHYQVLGAAFMRNRETGVSEPLGGLCADQMGLGKTVMMIANIVNEKYLQVRQRKRAAKEPTLIVATGSLLNQWARELNKHVEENHLRKPIKFFSSWFDGESPETIIANLMSQDIVLTTYHEVMRSFPKAKPPIELQTAEEKKVWWDKHYEEKKGILHHVKWHRVVLDEAQAIKNYLSRSSEGCRFLIATHRWAMSGTPIMNTIQELYPYFRFLKVPNTGSLAIFKANYSGKNEVDKVQRLNAMLSQFMIRRTHLDRMFGAPLLKLPKPTETTHWVQFNDLERQVYEIVHRRMVENINAIAKKGELAQNYSNIFTMMLRLRQLCGHVLLVETVMRDLLTDDDLLKLKDVAKLLADPANDKGREMQIRQLRAALDTHSSEQQREQDLEQTNEQQVDMNEVARPAARRVENTADLGRDHGKTYRFNKYLTELEKRRKWYVLKREMACVRCKKNTTTGMVTRCVHLFCQDCYLSSEGEESEGQKCDECDEIIHFHRSFEEYGAVMDRLGAEVDALGRRTRRRKNDKNDIYAEGDEAVKDWIDMYDQVLPSAKTIAIKAQIINWIKENPSVKIIVYTQFLSMIRILAKICIIENWGYVKYSGKMSIDSRDKAVDYFATEPDCHVMLASLKAGGIGLNLTMASKVILIDPWWNDAAEQQAFCRVYRIGQTKETTMTRLVVENTIDEEIMEMQARKTVEINTVMEPARSENRKPTIRELIGLFGPVQTDGDGNEFIIIDNVAENPIDTMLESEDRRKN